MRRWLRRLHDSLGVENTLRDERLDLYLGVSKALGDLAVSLPEQRRGCLYCRVAAGEVEWKANGMKAAERRLFLYYDHGTSLNLLTHEDSSDLLCLAAWQVNLGYWA
jgi:hypothetical protein